MLLYYKYVTIRAIQFQISNTNFINAVAGVHKLRSMFYGQTSGGVAASYYEGVVAGVSGANVPDVQNVALRRRTNAIVLGSEHDWFSVVHPLSDHRRVRSSRRRRDYFHADAAAHLFTSHIDQRFGNLDAVACNWD